MRKAGIIVSLGMNPPNKKGSRIRNLNRFFLVLNLSMRAIELTLHEINFKNTKSESTGGEFQSSFFSPDCKLVRSPDRISTANYSASARKEGYLPDRSFSIEG
jgi:hypothetical protein